MDTPQHSEIAHTQEEVSASGRCAACAAWKTMTIELEYPARIATKAATMGWSVQPRVAVEVNG